MFINKLIHISLMTIVFFLSLSPLSINAEENNRLVFNLRSHLTSLKNSEEFSALQKLIIISKLRNERKLSGDAYLPLMRSLIIEHVNVKGKDVPTERLKAYEEAISINGIDYLPAFQYELLEDVLNSNLDYQNGSLEKKLSIIIDLDKQQGSGTRFWASHYMERVLANMALKRTKGLKPTERGIAKLHLYKELKAKGIRSSWIGELQEEEALSEHLHFHSGFINMTSSEKINYIKKLNEKGLISVFTMSKYEAEYYVDLLLSDKKFRELNKEEKNKYLKKEQEEERIHMFTTGKIQETLNLE